jgi:hypothetical protein
LKVDLASMGPLKTLPYLVMFFMSNAGGWMGDALIVRGGKSVAVARKAVNTVGELRWSAGALPACALLAGEGGGSALSTSPSLRWVWALPPSTSAAQCLACNAMARASVLCLPPNPASPSPAHQPPHTATPHQAWCLASLRS